MTDTKTAGDDAGTESAITPRAVSGDVIASYEAMLAEVPDAGNAGVEAILEQIDAATDISGLDSPWQTGGLGQYVDQPLVVTGIRKMPSDFGSGLAFFLVIDGAIRATGEKVTAMSGSLSVVAQLVKAWSLDAFPLVVIPRLAKRPTKDGYFPQHLEIVGKA